MSFFDKNNILFPRHISKNLQNILESGIDFLDTLELSQKEHYKWIALKIEMENKTKTQEHFHDEIKKLIFGLNREIYKKQVETLKNKISAWDAQALKEYSAVMQKAKQHGIK